MENVAGGWRRLPNEKLHNLYASPNIKEDKMGRACSTNEKYEKCLQNFNPRL
jgi:hypothetical protein